jgi:flagellar hook-associated protein 3 FlgL
MRISESMRYSSVSNSLGNLEQRELTASQQASTGSRVNAPSDDPVAAAELARLNAAEKRNTGFQTAVANAQGDASIAESTLGSAEDTLSSIKALALQGANASLNASDRASLADQVDSLKAHLVSLANTQGGDGGYIFGGTKTDSTPFAASGAFSGNDNAHQVEISSGVTVRANASGAQAFTAAGGTDIFGTLDTLSTALRSNDSAGISGTLDALDASSTQIETARGESGLLLDRLSSTSAALTNGSTALTTRAVAVGQADPIAAYSSLTQLNNALTQAVAVARTTLSPSGNRFT